MTDTVEVSVVEEREFRSGAWRIHVSAGQSSVEIHLGEVPGDYRGIREVSLEEAHQLAASLTAALRWRSTQSTESN